MVAFLIPLEYAVGVNGAKFDARALLRWSRNHQTLPHSQKPINDEMLAHLQSISSRPHPIGHYARRATWLQKFAQALQGRRELLLVTSFMTSWAWNTHSMAPEETDDIQ